MIAQLEKAWKQTCRVLHNPYIYVVTFAAGAMLIYNSAKDRPSYRAYQNYREQHGITIVWDRSLDLKLSAKAPKDTPDYLIQKSRIDELESRMASLKDNDEYHRLEKLSDEECQNVISKSAYGLMLALTGAGGLGYLYLEKRKSKL
jgi:hypothetical protein